MALAPCRSCKQPVAVDAAACPHCGAPQPVKRPARRSGCSVLLLIALAFVALTAVLVNLPSDPRAGAGPRAAQANQAELEAALVRLRESNKRAVEIRAQNGNEVWAWYSDDGSPRDALARTYCVDLAELGVKRDVRVMIVAAQSVVAGEAPKFIGRATCRDGKDIRRR